MPADDASTAEPSQLLSGPAAKEIDRLIGEMRGRRLVVERLCFGAITMVLCDGAQEAAIRALIDLPPTTSPIARTPPTLEPTMCRQISSRPWPRRSKSTRKPFATLRSCAASAANRMLHRGQSQLLGSGYTPRLPGATEWCRDHPGSSDIPMASTGPSYGWSCKGRRAVAGQALARREHGRADRRGRGSIAIAEKRAARAEGITYGAEPPAADRSRNRGARGRRAAGGAGGGIF
jgi:hypothetical protein